MKSILDPTFNYVPAVQTDLRKTFARVRREQEKTKVAAVVAEVATTNVRTINRKDRKA